MLMWASLVSVTILPRAASEQCEQDGSSKIEPLSFAITLFTARLLAKQRRVAEAVVLSLIRTASILPGSHAVGCSAAASDQSKCMHFPFPSRVHLPPIGMSVPHRKRRGPTWPAHGKAKRTQLKRDYQSLAASLHMLGKAAARLARRMQVSASTPHIEWITNIQPVPKSNDVQAASPAPPHSSSERQRVARVTVECRIE